jgi:VIT1/CCC1 family predicted Fe2+/Mn2+ transporter/bacterioferritin (cytochrome b1)
MSSDATTKDSALSGNERRRILKILESNWQAEMRGCHTYELWAERETEPQRRAAFRALAKAEQHHADLWGARIRALGGSEPVYQGPLAGDADTITNRVGGTGLALRRLELDESHDIAKYAKQLTDLGDAPSTAILNEVIEDEREHSRTLSNLIRNRQPLARSSPEEARRSLDELLAARQKGQPQAAGWIGDAIYGVNDGLGAIFGIVSGVSGATLGNSKFVVIAGVVGMLASALSMGSGAYLAAKSEREIYQAEFARERDAVEYDEAGAREILSLSYQVRGLSAQLVRALAQERLNTTEEGLRKPLTSALSGALSTALGASIPIIPFFFASGYTAVIWAAAISLIAHFAVGAAKSLLTIRSWWASGLEMTLVGAVEGAITYVIGVGLGRIA